MVYRNSNLNTAESGFSRVSQREAMAPGYQVHGVRSAAERRSGRADWTPDLEDYGHRGTARGWVAQRPERNSVRKALDWVRRHPGYRSTPSQHALESMNTLARNPRH